MSNGFREIRDTSPLSMKLLNDQMRYLWTKIMGNIDDRDIKLESIKEKNLSSEIKHELGKISLAVTKDNVINSINLSTEGIAIDGSKVTISGENLDLSANESIRLAIGKIGGTNLVRNGNFAFADNSWNSFQWGTGQASFSVWSGDGDWILQDDSKATGVINSPTVDTPVRAGIVQRVSVTPGQIYTLQALLGLHRCIGSMTMFWFNANGVEIGVACSVAYNTDAGNVKPGGRGIGGYNQYISPTLQAPANAVNADIYILMEHSHNDGYLFLDNIKLEEGRNATAFSPSPFDMATKQNLISEINIAPGNIKIQAEKIDILGEANIPNLKADKIVGGTLDFNTITAVNINASSINAGNMSASRLSSGDITGVAITGGTITGATLQTASSGGVRMNNSVGFRVHDSSGRKRMDILPNQAHPTLALYDTAGNYDFTMSYRPSDGESRAGIWLSATSYNDLILFGKDVYAKSLLISSDREQKTNIEEVQVEGIEETIKNIKTYEYNLKADLKEETMGIMTMMSFEPNEPKKVLGVMADELPGNVLNQEENAVNLYSFSTMLLQGQQDQYNKINELQATVQNQQSIIDDLIRRIGLLESQAQ